MTGDRVAGLAIEADGSKEKGYWMEEASKLMLENRAWAREMTDIDPDFFSRQITGQTPRFLWIGCSDSRVPAESITNSRPGDLFVHRNIANLAHESDESFMSVLEYALVALRVKHIVVCGHDGCGGVRAGLSPPTGDLLHVDKRLGDLRRSYLLHREEVDATPEVESRVNRMVRVNVLEQVRRLASNPVVRRVRDGGTRLRIHGWIYHMERGVLGQEIMIDLDTAKSSEFSAAVRPLMEEAR